MTTIKVDATPQEIINAMSIGLKHVVSPAAVMRQIRDAATKQLPEPLKVDDVVRGRMENQPLRIVTKVHKNGFITTWCTEYGKVVVDSKDFYFVGEA